VAERYSTNPGDNPELKIEPDGAKIWNQRLQTSYEQTSYGEKIAQLVW
jgi:hypothetical protein